MTDGMPQITGTTWSFRRVRELRKKLGLTNEQFAARVGVVVRTVIRWQTGEEQPSPLAREKLDALARETA